MEANVDNRQTSVSALLTRLETSKKLRCSLTTLDRLGIPQIRIRRRVYYRQEAIIAWITANEQPNHVHTGRVV
jgi:hypothetical protein